MRFDDVPGHEPLKMQLARAVVNDQVAHAQLFAGREGFAALPMALAYAAFLTCTNRSPVDSCGECPSCQQNKKLIHPDVHFVFPVCSTAEIKGKDVVSRSFLPSWRSFIDQNPYGNLDDWMDQIGGENKQAAISRQQSREVIDALSLTSFGGGYKVMIIWLPELMHPTAANALLKILEEPSSKTVFLLVSENEEQLMTTMRSRVLYIPIRPFSDDDIVHYLTDHNESINQNIAERVARLSQGNLNVAMDLLKEQDTDQEQFFKDWMRKCFIRDYGALTQLAEQFASLSKRLQSSSLTYGLGILRASLLIHEEAVNLVRMNGGEKEFVSDFSKVLSPDMINIISKELENVHYYLKRNANAKIAFMNLSIRIVDIFKTTQYETT